MLHPFSERPIVILGAGLSGLSLAHALCEANVPHPIVLVDRRARWDRDRTWCTWLTGPLRFSDCITHRWGRWRTRAGSEDRIAESRSHPYVHIDAGLLYEAALDRLNRSSTVELRLGESVRSVEAGDVPRVHTSAGAIDAAVVFDALGANSPLQRERGRDRAGFAQRFVGWEIEASDPVFDPGTATLMDFRPHTGPGVTFIYVLPFSSTRALIEHTAIEPFDAPPTDRDAALEHELRNGFRLSDWQVLRRERGLIPMTARSFPTHHGQGIYTLGAAAGAIRPSSGYAFSRIQQQVDAVVGALVSRTRLPTRIGSVRGSVLDRVFLDALAHSNNPEALFLAAASTNANAFARFMTDVSSPQDEARMIAALPLREMTRAALSTAGSAAGTRRSVHL